MIGLKQCGAFLIAGVLLAGSAWAGGDPDQGLEKRTSGQVSIRNETTILSEATFSGPADGTVSEKVSVNKEETVPTIEPASKPEPAPKVESAPKSNVSPKPEAADKEDGTEDTVEAATIADPIEPFNRAMFTFNDKLYFWVLKPVAQGYNVVMPEPARISARNLFKNVKMPIRLVNSLLQGKFVGAGTELARFGINTTIGVAGLFDMAKDKFDLDPSDEDFGQTLGFYGMGEMLYIVWPFLGPSTVRDSIGMAGDSFLDPISYISYIGPWEASIGVNIFERVNKTSLELGTYEDLKESSLEPYIAFRDGYIQLRKKQISK